MTAPSTWVRCTWLTPSGKQREVVGEVIDRRGVRVRIRYERSSSSGRTFSWGVRDVWRMADQCTPIPKPGESDGHAIAMGILSNERERASAGGAP